MRLKQLFFLICFCAILTGPCKARAHFSSTTATSAATNPGWQEVKTVRQLWEYEPDRIRKVLQALDEKQETLATVRTHAAAGDTVAAAEALLAHFRQSKTAQWLLDQPFEGHPADLLALAKQLRSDTLHIGSTTVKIPPTADGGWQWNYQGPERDAEFGYSLNGHKYLVALIAAWQQQGDEAYVSTFDRLIRDWILHHPLPAENDPIYRVLAATGVDWRDIDEVIWRTLEAGNRLGVSWPQAFYHLQPSEAFSPAARLLMLYGIAEHAGYLRKHHKAGHNWTTMEMNGLALVGLTFPEFRDSDEWATYALDIMETEINRQVYPDGLQTELSSKTQWVALQRFESIAHYFQQSGRSIKDSYLRRVEEMYHFLAYSMRPDGHQPINNDSDREDLRPRVLAAARTYQRPDWTWIATNGQSGQSPEGLPSVVFPWGGIHVMRSGWDAQAQWAFFDAGPFGTGHQHSDMLHLSVSAYGKDLLVDGGRYTHKDYFSFDPTIWRGYFRSSFSHNVLLVDGKGQNAGPLRAESPLEAGVDYVNTPEFDYARGTFTSGYEGVAGAVSHTRAVLYVREKCWVVVDHVETDQPRQLQALWHFAPTCSVRVAGTSLRTENTDEANLQLIPLGGPDWELAIVKGQEKPFIQGWYSEDYDKKEPNPTAVYTRKEARTGTFAWVIVPADGELPKIKTKFLKEDAAGVRIKVRIGKAPPMTVVVPWEAAGKPKVD